MYVRETSRRYACSHHQSLTRTAHIPNTTGSTVPIDSQYRTVRVLTPSCPSVNSDAIYLAYVTHTTFQKRLKRKYVRTVCTYCTVQTIFYCRGGVVYCTITMRMTSKSDTMVINGFGCIFSRTYST